MARIDIKGFNKTNKQMNKVTRYITELPKKLDMQLSKENTAFMNRVLKGARVRAPVDTGALKHSIKLAPVRRGKTVKKWKVVAGNTGAAAHAVFQEEGYKAHYAPIMNSAKMAPGRYFVSKFTPFLSPAVEYQLTAFAQNLNDATDRGLK